MFLDHGQLVPLVLGQYQITKIMMKECGREKMLTFQPENRKRSREEQAGTDQT